MKTKKRTPRELADMIELECVTLMPYLPSGGLRNDVVELKVLARSIRAGKNVAGDVREATARVSRIQPKLVTPWSQHMQAIGDALRAFFAPEES